MKYDEFITKCAASNPNFKSISSTKVSNDAAQDASQVDPPTETTVPHIGKLERKFHNTWQFWYHHHRKNWKLSGYQKIFKITTIGEFWDLYNNFDAIGGLFSQHFFIMRDGITPLWEDKQNSTGGAWSFKVNTYDAAELWLKLSGHVLGESLLDEDMVRKHNIPPCDINGLSICVKKENVTIIKIWNRSTRHKSIKLLPSGLTKKYNVIYKEHCPEY